MVDVDSVIGIRANDGTVDWRVHWQNVTENKVRVAMEECCLQTLCHMVRHVDRGIDTFQKHKIAFNPFAE